MKRYDLARCLAGLLAFTAIHQRTGSLVAGLATAVVIMALTSPEKPA